MEPGQRAALPKYPPPFGGRNGSAVGVLGRDEPFCSMGACIAAAGPTCGVTMSESGPAGNEPISSEELGKRIDRLFGFMGIGSRRCDSCHAVIYFMPTKNGKFMPIGRGGRPHFIDCPNAEQHRKRRKGPGS